MATTVTDTKPDPFGRKFSKLRLSLTAACNYACTYCVPNGKKLQPAKLELSANELIDLTAMLREVADLEQLRITGGEPLVARNLDAFLEALPSLGFTDVAMTTNGQFLKQKARQILDAGITRVNVSLDTLNPLEFRKIAKSGDLETVLAGVDTMLDAGAKVKINMVPMRGQNDSQIVPMLEYCLARGIELRYIELMNMGHLREGALFDEQYIGMDELLSEIGKTFPYQEASSPVDSTAERYEAIGHGNFGIIANTSKPFCSTCSRLRLASNGRLFGCLSSAQSHDLRPVLGMTPDEAKTYLEETLGKAMRSKQRLAFQGETTVMKFIGG